MTNQIDPNTQGSIPIVNDPNLISTQNAFQNSIPINQPGVIQTTTRQVTTTTNTIPSTGVVMGTNNIIGDNAGDVAFSTNNIDGNNLTTTKKTVVTTTHYGVNPNEGAGITTTTNTYQVGQGQLMGVGGEQNNGLDVNYTSNLGNSIELGANQGFVPTITNTTNMTKYELGQNEGTMTQGKEGQYLMGVGGGVEDEAPDVTYSSNTRGLGAAAAKTTTTTTITTQTHYGQGQAQGQLIQGQVIQGGQAGLTTTTTTTETIYGKSASMAASLMSTSTFSVTRCLSGVKRSSFCSYML